MPAQDKSPPASPSESPTSTSISNGTQTPLSLDLSALPPLITPSPPSNTLLITNLNSLATFLPQNLQHIHTLLSTPTPLNSFSPLRSFRRIIVSYPTVEAAIEIRQLLDGSPLSENDRVRIYFGEPTPILGDGGEDQHLKAPSLGKLLFISPPPSPPAGWEIREEEPPNKDVHAEDLQRALAGLGNHGKERRASADDAGSPMSEDEKEELQGNRKRSGTGSMMVYHPKHHGDNESLPAVMVIDTTAGAEEEGQESPGSSSPVDGRGQGGGRILTHTARPPVELMEDT
ncbi:hypothetical protein HO133_002230 [Letharia lupina]|uniref:Calcipressin n=2 Tax=Letharia TaxID=112415 RepID=A0A8H6FAL8_9LECA|nr:uncharacterized protein HO133_002230 [Letharia lupina]XP_037167180.1 uncharacterized protein HO173_004063 [Letharia columbiana]KAF6221375.1 hypothetical protein HO133_002230 [Letharia lupina]KAF6237862.1 hypothetical protein HO173_004063 [Letharia columbiana]